MALRGTRDGLADKIREQAQALASEENSAETLLEGLLDPIMQASTRIEASIAYRSARTALEQRTGVLLEEALD